MNKIGVFICNYNGIEWTLRCITSLKKQTLKKFDVCVVDNASTDGSVEILRERYGNEVEILCNQENLGGAGGFDCGLRHGLGKGYDYIVLLDNDIELEEHAIQNMYEYMQEHKAVGIVGSKVMIMDAPDLIQDYGCRLDFNTFKEYPQYGLCKEEDVPDEWECDYVPTCAVMARASALSECGTMPADNFIYYDDIELSHRMVKRGYKVMALGSSKVWHKGGFRKAATSTFPKYYFMRNRLHFFSKYTAEQDIDKFIDTMLTELYSQLFGYYTKNMKELFLAVNFAFQDYLQGIRGKALEGRVLSIENRDIPFEQVVSDKHHIRIWMIDNFLQSDELDIFHIIRYLLSFIQKKNTQDQIAVCLSDCGYTDKEFLNIWEKVVEMDRPDYPVPKLVVDSDSDAVYELELHLCEHVKYVNKDILPAVWADRYANCITSLEEYQYISAYKENEKFFCELHKPLMYQRIWKIRDDKT